MLTDPVPLRLGVFRTSSTARAARPGGASHRRIRRSPPQGQGRHTAGPVPGVGGRGPGRHGAEGGGGDPGTVCPGEAGHEDRRGVGLGQRGRVEGRGPPGRVQDGGGTRTPHPPRVRQAGGRRGARTAPGRLPRRARLGAMAAGPRELCVPGRRGGAAHAGTTKRGGSPARMPAAWRTTRHGWAQERAAEGQAS